MAGITASITADTVPDAGTGFAAVNLINNPSTRMLNTLFDPVVGINQVTDANIESCYRTD